LLASIRTAYRIAKYIEPRYTGERLVSVAAIDVDAWWILCQRTLEDSTCR